MCRNIRRLVKNRRDKTMKDIWKKFIPCDCQTEGVMLSYEYDDGGYPLMDMAFFSHGLTASHHMSIKERIRWCWNIITKGCIYNDMVMLNQENAKMLGIELLKFAKKNPKTKGALCLTKRK
jgi:hypothetical protein